MVRTEKITEQKYEVYFNSVFLGTFELDIHGFSYLRNNNFTGSETSYSLRIVADALDKLNKPFEDGFTRYFEDKAKAEYNQVLKETGMFYEWYPQLTGDYETDKVEWLKIYKEIEDLRVNNITF